MSDRLPNEVPPDRQPFSVGTLEEARERHAQLVSRVREHDHAYYVLAQPSMSDQEYDRLYRELVDLEQRSGAPRRTDAEPG